MLGKLFLFLNPFRFSTLLYTYYFFCDKTRISNVDALVTLSRVGNKYVFVFKYTNNPVFVFEVLKIYIFIALIHPIQWTIALPVGATGPAKRQKKTSCIYYRQDRSQSVHSPGGARYFIYCLPIDVIASFSFGAKECAEEFLQRYVFEVLQRTLPSFLFFISTE